MRTTIPAALAAPALAVMTALTLPATAVSAAPVNAPNGSTGTAVCSDGSTYTFVVNGTPDQAHGTAWSSAFLTSTADGSQAIFHPTSLSLSFSAPGQPVPPAFTVSKAGGPGPISCQVTGHPNSFPEATFTGTVTGTITQLG